MEGVQIRDIRVGGELTATHMNMNGTWVDVTGRINVTRNEPPTFDNALTVSGEIFSEQKTFGNATHTADHEDIMPFTTTLAPKDFNNTWASKQSRLIALKNDRQILSRFLNLTELEQLKTGKVSLRTSVMSSLKNAFRLWISDSIKMELEHVQLEVTEENYLYNTILSDDQMFVLDSYGLEVFVVPRK